MNGFSDNEHGISSTERAAFKKALTAYYTGNGRIAEVFAEVEPGLIDRYYRRKKAFAAEMAEIEREARDEARKERSFQREGFEAQQERMSWELEKRVGEALLEHLPVLLRIALGEPRVVEVPDGDGGTMLKTIIPYPRDQIAAMKLLLEIARYGVLPKSYWARSSSTVEDTQDANRGGLMPIFAGNTAFSRLEGTAPDGTRVVINVDGDKDAVNDADDGVD
jgi:hypothetical protein